MKPQKLSNVDVIFSTDVSHLMPKEVPEEFKDCFNSYVKLTERWFYQGMSKSELKPKGGIDKVDAFNHLRAILNSFEPAHEHKIAGVAYLMSQWFEIVGGE